MDAANNNRAFDVKKTLNVKGKVYQIFSLNNLEKKGFDDIKKLPKSLKILLENLLRFEDGTTVKKQDIDALLNWTKTCTSDHEIAYRPTRVLMQDFTGVPAVVDLAAMRDAMNNMKGDTKRINPLSAVDLVIDHSVMVDKYATPEAFRQNVEKEFERNFERYKFLRWGQQAFEQFRVVPPGTGICHQVNLEYLSKTVWTKEVEGITYAFPDTLVGTDSHTTMVNGLSVLGWGVGGIEAEAVMLGQPISMLIPEVIGFKLTGALTEGTTATDLVLTITEILRKKGVVGKFVEFFGPGLDNLTLADRATISNMAPEYGATCGFFPIDNETINYLRFTGRDDNTVNLVEFYAKEQGLWRDEKTDNMMSFTDQIDLDISLVMPSLAGPKRPQDKVLLSDMQKSFRSTLTPQQLEKRKTAAVNGENFILEDGAVVIAAITSCTNTSNPNVMIGAGLVAKKALEKGLTVKPWVKTSLAPGSQVVTDYLNKAELQEPLNKLGFNLVGYGCTTCIGNSGPLHENIHNAIEKNDLSICSVLSGNRNFEGRVHPLTKANYLASPPLVVAYALAGTVDIDLTKDPIGTNTKGEDIYLADIWPTNLEIAAYMAKSLTPEMFRQRYANVFDGDADWKQIKTTTGLTYKWDQQSTYVKNPPFFTNMTAKPQHIQNIENARILAILGDSVTTDHISPAGSIKKDSPAGKYLSENNVDPQDFNSYGARRGNHEVMMRGTFANIRIRNEMLSEVEGGYTKLFPSEKIVSIYDAAMAYQDNHTPLVIIAGKEYGTGSSRDWAAKGTKLLGVKAVIAESFERIHRSNLIGMGVIPLKFTGDTNRKSLQLTGNENIDILGINGILTPKMTLTLVITRADRTQIRTEIESCILTENEVSYFEHGGILSYVLRNMIDKNVA